MKQESPSFKKGSVKVNVEDPLMKEPTFVDFKRRLVLTDQAGIDRRFADEAELWTEFLHDAQEQIDIKIEELRGTFTPEMSLAICTEKTVFALTLYEELLDIPTYATRLSRSISDPDRPPALGRAKTYFTARVDEAKNASLRVFTLSTETSPFFTLSTIVRVKRPKLTTLHLSRQASPTLNQLTTSLFATHTLDIEQRRAVTLFTKTLIRPLQQILKAPEWSLQTFRVTPYIARYLLVYRYSPRRSIHVELDLVALREHVLAHMPKT